MNITVVIVDNNNIEKEGAQSCAPLFYFEVEKPLEMFIWTLNMWRLCHFDCPPYMGSYCQKCTGWMFIELSMVRMNHSFLLYRLNYWKTVDSFTFTLNLRRGKELTTLYNHIFVHVWRWPCIFCPKIFYHFIFLVPTFIDISSLFHL